MRQIEQCKSLTIATINATEEIPGMETLGFEG